MPEAIKPLVYVSYAWRNRSPAGQDAQPSKADDIEPIVNELCQVLSREDNVEVGRDKKRVKTGDSIVDFAREIASGGLILAVISHKSLRSDWCMVHELLQAFRRRNFDPAEFGADVLALVLEDALNDIRDPRYLIRHWLARLEQERELMELADPGRTGSPESWKTVDQLAELRGRLPDLIHALRIRAMPRGAEAIREQGFHAIRKLVRQRLTEKSSYRGLKKSLSNSQNPTRENSKVPERRHLFVSYSHADRVWVDRLKRMMAPLLRSGGQELRLWDDSRIAPGMPWREEMEMALAEAKVVLLLVSDDFLASEFVMGREVPALLAAAEAEGVTVLWVSLSPSLVEETEIYGYQAVLPPAPSLAEMSEIQRDRALIRIAERLWESLREPALEGEREERDSEPSPAPLVGDDEPSASEHILRWRVRCRIWREPLATEVDLPMVWVPSDTAAQVGEFLLGVEPVSLRQWREVVGGSLLETTLTLATPARGDLDDQPVTGISQEQALEFCRLLALHSGRYYELPSEEQWDHACRAGSVSAYSWGEAWSGRLARETANPWGLRRMHGSVWQWCRGGALRGGAANEPVGLRVCCLPFGTPSFHLQASKSQWRPRITRAACARVLARPLSEAEFTQLEQALQRFHILGLSRLRLFLSLLADRLAGGADDPQHPLSLEMVPDGLRRLATPAAMDPFTTAAFAWRERDWRRLADSARPPQELLAELGLASGERQQAVLHAIDRAASAFPEPR